MKYPQTLIVGAGNIAQTIHLPLFKKLGVPVVQIIDPDAGTLAKAQSFFPHASIDTTLDSVLPNVACAVIASPSKLHAEQARTLIGKNIPVLCEKPLATDARQAAELAELSRTKSCVLHVGYYRRYHEAAQYIRTLTQSNEVGAPIRCLVVAGAQMNALPKSFFDPALAGGGMTMDFGVHVLDMLHFWFRELELRSYADDAVGNIEANALIELSAHKQSQSIPISVALSRTNPLGFIAMIEFERGTIRYELNTGHLIQILRTEPGLEGSLETYSRVKQFGAPAEAIEYFERQWNEFIGCIEGATATIANLQDAVATSDLVERCYKNRKPLTFVWEEMLTPREKQS